MSNRDNLEVIALDLERGSIGECIIVRDNDLQGGGVYRHANLRDGFFYGSGRTTKEALLSLANNLQKQADEIREKADRFDY